jgi:hypothetical protein
MGKVWKSLKFLFNSWDIAFGWFLSFSTQFSVSFQHIQLVAQQKLLKIFSLKFYSALLSQLESSDQFNRIEIVIREYLFTDSQVVQVNAKKKIFKCMCVIDDDAKKRFFNNFRANIECGREYFSICVYCQVEISWNLWLTVFYLLRSSVAKHDRETVKKKNSSFFFEKKETCIQFKMCMKELKDIWKMCDIINMAWILFLLKRKKDYKFFTKCDCREWCGTFLNTNFKAFKFMF